VLAGKLGFTNAQPTHNLYAWEWHQSESSGPIVIPAGTSNGICLKNTTAVAGASVNIEIEFVETLYTK